MGLLDGKVALITGASRGIGKAIALKYAAEGADVAFTDLVVNQETVAEIAALGHKVKAYESNAADFEQTQQVVEQVLADFGKIDILVNNAGITKDGLAMRMTEQQWDAVIAVNMKSAFNYMHAVLPAMARAKSGSIINMASIAGQMGNPGQVNGFIVSDMTNALPEAVREEYLKQIPLRRGGTPEDIANAALFLASDLSSYITGQVIPVNGGLYC